MPTSTPTPTFPQVCYHGPREGVLPFFDTLGFTCPERRGVADFLVEVSTPSDQRVRGAAQYSRAPQQGDV